MRSMPDCRGEEGQAIVLVARAMSIFLLGAVGLAVDGAHIYAQFQMAQAAADAAAQAGIMSIFNGTNGTGGTGFSTGSAFTCSTTDTRTPCAYASKNGFGGTSTDTVTIDFPPASAYPGVSLSTSDPTNLLRATVQRNVNTTLMRMLGPTVSTVKATATGAIVSVVSPVPILVTHPTLSGALSSNGGVQITICGGPPRSIQINSGSSTAVTTNGSGSIDLSRAGPPDPGNCTTGTGADFGTWGGPSSPPFTFAKGSTGHYVEPASPVLDPLAAVTPPPVPTAIGSHTSLAKGVSGCPASPKKGCELYSPGLYTSGIDGQNSTPIFKPGIYYIQSTQGMSCASNCDMYMATGFTDGASGTSTGWTGNMLVYNTGPSGNASNAGAFSLGANGTINLTGSPGNSAYDGILFFQDRNSVAQTHSLGGGGGLTLVGTVYLTNTLATMKATPAQYQALDLQGNSGSSTLIQGELIVGTLHMAGNANITMNLSSAGSLNVRQIAMVN